MATTKLTPNTIHLGGPIHRENVYTAGEGITPGHLIEMYSDSGVLKWRKNASATNKATHCVALENIMLNRTIDDAYVANEVVLAGFLNVGSTWYGLIPSGEDIAVGDLLQSNADGTLKEATSAAAGDNVARYQSLDGPGAVTELTRIRVQVIN